MVKYPMCIVHILHCHIVNFRVVSDKLWWALHLKLKKKTQNNIELTREHCDCRNMCLQMFAQKWQRLVEMKLICRDLRSSNRKLIPLHTASSKSWKKLLALLALQVRRKKAFQRAARAGQSRSEARPAVTETTCAQWRVGCFNLVVGMGEASGCHWQDVKNEQLSLKLKALKHWMQSSCSLNAVKLFFHKLNYFV